jgi:hypothetical protein
MRGRLVTYPTLVALTLVSASAASAQQPPPGVTVKGKLSKRQARSFIVRELPPVAAAAMLKDRRAAFFRPAGILVEPARACERENRSIVSCRFAIRLRPTQARRAVGWTPIRCTGVDRVARLSDGGIGGELGNYRCVSLPAALGRVRVHA